jgi:hypothetical protein
MTRWTLADLAQMTETCMSLDDDDAYCRHCTVAPLHHIGDVYCDACLDEMLQAMAQSHREEQLMENGWY